MAQAFEPVSGHQPTRLKRHVLAEGPIDKQGQNNEQHHLDNQPFAVEPRASMLSASYRRKLWSRNLHLALLISSEYVILAEVSRITPVDFSRLTPAANRTSGTAVTGPPPINSRSLVA